MLTIADDSKYSLHQEPSASTQDAKEMETAVPVLEERQVATGNQEEADKVASSVTEGVSSQFVAPDNIDSTSNSVEIQTIAAPLVETEEHRLAEHSLQNTQSDSGLQSKLSQNESRNMDHDEPPPMVKPLARKAMFGAQPVGLLGMWGAIAGEFKQRQKGKQMEELHESKADGEKEPSQGLNPKATTILDGHSQDQSDAAMQGTLINSSAVSPTVQVIDTPTATPSGTIAETHTDMTQLLSTKATSPGFTTDTPRDIIPPKPIPRARPRAQKHAVAQDESDTGGEEDRINKLAPTDPVVQNELETGEDKHSLPAVPDVQPGPIAEEQQSEPVVNDAKPEVVAEETQPGLVVAETEPELVVEEINPEAVGNEAEPELVVEETTPEAVDDEAQPELVVEETQLELVVEETFLELISVLSEECTIEETTSNKGQSDEEMGGEEGEFQLKRSTRSVHKNRSRLQGSRRRRAKTENEKLSQELHSQSKPDQRQLGMEQSPGQQAQDAAPKDSSSATQSLMVREAVQGEVEEVESEELPPVRHRSSRTISKWPQPRARRRKREEEADTTDSVLEGEFYLKLGRTSLRIRKTRPQPRSIRRRQAEPESEQLSSESHSLSQPDQGQLGMEPSPRQQAQDEWTENRIAQRYTTVTILNRKE